MPATSASGSYDITLSTTLTAQIYGNGLSNHGAGAQGLFLKNMYDYIQASPRLQEALKGSKDGYDVYKGAKAAIGAAGYKGSLNLLIRDHGAAGGAGVLSVFVDRFGAMAKAQGIELNECALSVSKVALDIGGAGAGAVSSVTGVGIVLLGVSMVATYTDSSALAASCFNAK